MSHKRKQAVRDDGEELLLPRRAFSVSGAPDFSQAEPQTAEEYLRRVKWEAKRQPRVLTSNIDPRSFDHRQTRGYVRAIDLVPAASPLVLPSPQWQTSFASQFADIRLALLRYASRPQGQGAQQPHGSSTPAPRAFPQWMRYCLGADYDPQHCVRGRGRQRQTAPTPKDDEEDAQEEKDESEEANSSSSSGSSARVEQQMLPTLQVVAGWDQSTTRGLLSRLVDHLQRCVAAVSASPSPLSPSVAALPASFLWLPSPAHTVWLYCALLHLEKPLLPETDSELLQLYKVCGRIRHEAGQLLEQRQLQSRTGGEAEVKAADEPAALAASDCAMYCNLLMTIVDKIFGQRVASAQTH